MRLNLGLIWRAGLTRVKPAVAVIAGACALAACGQPPVVVQESARPAMWEARGAVGRAILLGSIHALPNGVDWQHGEVRLASMRADELWLELAPSESQKAITIFQTNAANEPVPPIAGRFDPASALAIENALDGSGMDRDDAQKVESWALGLLVDSAAQRDNGFAASNGVEARLTATFRQADKPITGLETAQGQLALLDDLPESVQRQLVMQALQDAKDGPAKLQRMTRAWALGDTVSLMHITNDALLATPELRAPLLTQRNDHWANTIALRLRRPGTVLIAVGAGHLVGPQSVIEQLQNRGVTVRRIQ